MSSQQTSNACVDQHSNTVVTYRCPATIPYCSMSVLSAKLTIVTTFLPILGQQSQQHLNSTFDFQHP
jgi:hypothetical protein